MFTRRSRASTFLVISARLSENGTMVTFALDTSLDTLRPREKDGSEGVAAVLVSVHNLEFRGGNYMGLLSNTGLFLSTGNRYLFLLQHH